MLVVREQMPVGQGCFHIGMVSIGESLGQPKTRFRYIYDCGSTNRQAIRSAIDQFKSETSIINALFVSHFDDDHVCGLDQLLAVSKIDTVYIPYVNDLVPILDLIELEKHGAVSSSLIEAIFEPDAWFGRRGVRRVVRVSGGELPPDGPPIPEPFDSPDESSGVDGELTFKEFPTAPRRVRQRKRSECADLYEMMPGSSVVILAGNKLIDWLLLPHVSPVSKERHSAFRTALRATLSLKRSERLTMARLSDALRSKIEREALRQCYDEVISRGALRMHNRISMSLYSGPTGRGRNQGWSRYVNSWRNHCLISHYSQGVDAVGWIGTGDATLNVKKVRTEWQKAYRSVERHVSTLLLPHHGSHHNFHDELLDANNVSFFVASAGKPSRYEHPSPIVIRKILAQKKIFRHVSQRQESRFVETIERN